VVHGDQSPVGDNTGDAKGAIGVLAGNQVFDCSGVEKLDVGEGEDFGEKGGGKESLELKKSAVISIGSGRRLDLRRA